MKILLIGGDTNDVLVVRRALAGSGRDGYRLEHAETVARALERARDERPEVLLLAVGPQGDGLAPLLQLRKNLPDLPVVALVRPGDDELGRLAVKEGAQDWLVKARIDADSIQRSIRYAIERTSLAHELADAKEQLNLLSLRDEPTGLYNRRGFTVLCEQQMRLARRWDAGLLLMVLDIDGLDAINERFGRSAGDRALTDVAQLVRESFRDSDVKARVGGDEFAVLLNGAGDGTCEVLDSRLTMNLERLNERRKDECPLSLSGGVARWVPSSGEGVGELLGHAEHLMHQQKRGTATTVGCGSA
ncbi:MAG: GGDEF domain-containing protein [Actinomycetota bacterium]